ncbi:winged helix-turn-helix transcriptional regulator [Motilibacter aurantiacus]|uniref:winged helix-turn-helix transcriptional regulator n=1 Tax=Motilibacter aurantiacus TaxID=2714955 RepID=UPI002F2B5709
MEEPLADELLRAPAAGCGVERALEILEGKWSTLVLRELLSGPLRFTELRARLGGPSPKTLTDRLRMLEHQGVLTRTVHAEVPPRVVYELTARGHSIRPVLMAMLQWGEQDAAADVGGRQAGVAVRR